MQRNSITFIHRGFYNKLPINLQIRLIKNKNDYNKCISKAFRTSRNLFRLTNIGVKYGNNLPSSLINISNLTLFSQHFKKNIHLILILYLFHILFKYFNVFLLYRYMQIYIYIYFVSIYVFIPIYLFIFYMTNDK